MMSPVLNGPAPPEEAKRIGRVLRIVQLIGAYPRQWTRARLAGEFELSERQIDKDLELIRHALCYDLRRSHDGYYFERGPSLKPVDLTVPEALALALGAQQARDTGSVDAAVVAAALARLEAALPPAIVPYLRRAAEGHQRAFGPVRERGPVLATLEQALAEGRKVRIGYTTASRNGAASERVIAPYYLMPYERSWLVIAYDDRRDQVLEFKVDRIGHWELTDEHYTVPADFEVAAYLGPAWGALRAQDAPVVEVVLRFNPEAARWVCDERWHHSQQAEWQEDGGLVMKFRCTVTNELVRWVLSFGARVRVEAPAELRELVLREARGVAQYGAAAC